MDPSTLRSVAALALLLALGAVAEPEHDHEHGVGPPSGEAVPLAAAPVLDGDVLGDAVWRDMTPITDFVQVQPLADAPASQRTEVYLGFTEEAFYIAVVCHDDEPDALVVPTSRRDAWLWGSDNFEVVFDTFSDHQNGFAFATNPAGVQVDTQLTHGGFNANGNWDTTWSVQAVTGDFGWSAEFEIPFRSLRYPSEEVQTWGVNFQRNIGRNNEIAHWAPIPRQFSLYRLVLAGRVAGIRPPPQRNFKIMPYLRGEVGRTGSAGTGRDGDAGLDVKYSLTPSLTLDVTYNTDFAQVEADQQQVNLNRFSLFFPEKRPFFLENAGKFTVGGGNVNLFHSRRIGIGEGGRQLPIDGGARVSGKLGRATNVGLLHMRAGAAEDDEAGGATDFSVLRVSRELPNRSAVGMFFAGRDGAGSDNQTFAVDGWMGIGDVASVVAWGSRTRTPGIDEDDHAFQLRGYFDSEDWSFNGSVTEIGQGFNPEVGWLGRQGVRSVDLFGQWTHRPDDWMGLLDIKPHISYSGHWDFDGFYESGFLHVDNSWNWKNGAWAYTGFNVLHEGVKEAFPLGDDAIVPAGEYDTAELIVGGATDNRSAFSAGLNLVAGGFFHGERLGVWPFLGYRVGETFSTGLAVNRNRIDLPEVDAFSVDLVSLRLSYSFTPRVSAQLYVQHNDQTDLLATNFRFSWLQSANAGLYVVYNEADERTGERRRALILKYSHIVDVL